MVFTYCSILREKWEEYQIRNSRSNNVLTLFFFKAVYRRAKRLGIASEYNNKEKNPIEHLLLKKLMNLSLLPHDKVAEGLEYLKSEVNRLVLDLKRLAKWEKIFQYFDREWMKIVGPKNFSVFNALDRTDNNAESYHRDLNSLLGKNPGCPDLIGMNFDFKSTLKKQFSSCAKSATKRQKKSLNHIHLSSVFDFWKYFVIVYYATSTENSQFHYNFSHEWGKKFCVTSACKECLSSVFCAVNSLIYKIQVKILGISKSIDINSNKSEYIQNFWLLFNFICR